ncbi:PDZ domain-containing protein [Dyella silvatica]|uniref:PDZ domain-containing protein n=1 Tax=Dyella silvatica TaxID=2992128 RepID=UPI00225A1451|nr:PDZ domain-containing protein [Dyella silvatica]
MRQFTFAGLKLVLGVAMIMPAIAMAGDWFNYVGDSGDSMNWRSNGQVLTMDSAQGAGITVTRTRPEPLWGLQKGDVIEAVNEQPVKHVGELLERLKASAPAMVALTLRRGTDRQTIRVAAADYARLVPPEPPSPPVPPAPPELPHAH